MVQPMVQHVQQVQQAQQVQHEYCGSF